MGAGEQSRKLCSAGGSEGERMDSEGGQDGVQQITIQLGGVSISATSAGTASGSGITVNIVNSTSTSNSSNTFPPAASSGKGISSAAPEPQFAPSQGAGDSAPTESDQVHPSVVHLARQLKVLPGLPSPEARIQRAFAAGQGAGRVLRGEATYPPRAPPLQLSNSCWVVLRSPVTATPVLCRSAAEFWAQAGGKPLPAETVCFGLATLSEAEAFCRGAGLPGLPVSK